MMVPRYLLWLALRVAGLSTGISVVLGLWLLFSFDRGKWGEPWLWVKIALALALTGLHGFFIAQGKKLAKGERRYSGKFWRMISEVPFIIAVVIVLLATIEPR